MSVYTCLYTCLHAHPYTCLCIMGRVKEPSPSVHVYRHVCRHAYRHVCLQPQCTHINMCVGMRTDVCHSPQCMCAVCWRWLRVVRFAGLRVWCDGATSWHGTRVRQFRTKPTVRLSLFDSPKYRVSCVTFSAYLHSPRHCTPADHSTILYNGRPQHYSVQQPTTALFCTTADHSTIR